MAWLFVYYDLCFWIEEVAGNLKGDSEFRNTFDTNFNLKRLDEVSPSSKSMLALKF